ncbi:MAG: hypothetical protein ACOC9R_05320 [bacterium]
MTGTEEQASGFVDVGDGVTVPAEITGTEHLDGATVRLRAVYRPDTGRYAVVELTVEADEVTGELIRSVPVASLLTKWALRFIGPGAVERPPADLVQTGPTDETLRWVARAYRVALLVGAAPTQAVAETFDVARGTAGRWVTRSRDRGFLTVTDPRGAKGRR